MKKYDVKENEKVRPRDIRSAYMNGGSIGKTSNEMMSSTWSALASRIALHIVCVFACVCVCFCVTLNNPERAVMQETAKVKREYM